MASADRERLPGLPGPPESLSQGRPSDSPSHTRSPTQATVPKGQAGPKTPPALEATWWSKGNGPCPSGSHS